MVQYTLYSLCVYHSIIKRPFPLYCLMVNICSIFRDFKRREKMNLIKTARIHRVRAPIPRHFFMVRQMRGSIVFLGTQGTRGMVRAEYYSDLIHLMGIFSAQSTIQCIALSPVLSPLHSHLELLVKTIQCCCLVLLCFEKLYGRGL